MYILKSIFLIVLILCALIVFIKVFSTPLKLAMKLALNTFFGFVSLLLFNLLGYFTGVTIGVNVINSLVIGVFGIPGFFLLLMIRWLFMS